MSEVHRYQVVTMLSASGATIGYDPHGPDVVMASAFDEATRLFLDAAERCVAAERRENELQQRLTAADERADVLEGLLREVQKSARKQGWASGYPTLFASVDAALKPAEGVGDDTTLEEDREDFKKVFVRINTKQGQSISLADMIARYEKKP